MKVITGQALLRYELLCSIQSIVYFQTYELRISTHLKNYLSQDNLAGGTGVSFSAFAWDSPCLWLVLNYWYNSSSFLSLSYIKLPLPLPSSLALNPRVFVLNGNSSHSSAQPH